MENVISTTVLSPQDTNTLIRTAKWGRLLALVVFGVVGIMLVSSAFIGSLFARLLAMQAQLSGAQDLPPAPAEELLQLIGGLSTAVFLIVAALYFVPALFLYQHASRILTSLHGVFDPVKFSAGLSAQRRLYTFLGVLTMLVLGLYALLFLFFMLAFGFAAAM